MDNYIHIAMVEKRKKYHPLLKVLKWIGIAILSIILIIALMLGGLTLWLTPERLSQIVNEEISKNVNADVKISNVRFTLWSTFPHLSIEADSIRIVSRNFDSIPSSLKAELPEDASFLFSSGKFRGGINLRRLLAHQIYLRDVEVDSINVNLVALTDSINNYEIVASGRKSEIPYFNIDTLRLSRGGKIAYTGVPSQTHATINLSGASLIPIAHEKNLYKLSIQGKVSAESERLTILRDFPFGLAGEMALRFKPFGVSTTDYNVALGNVKGKMGFNLNLGRDVSIDRFSYRLDNFTLSDILSLLPAGKYPILSRINADMDVTASARLLSPYNFSSTYLPSIEVNFLVPDGEMIYSLSDNETFRMRHIGLMARLMFDGHNPDASYIDVPRFGMQAEGIKIAATGSVTNLVGSPNVTARISGNANLPALASYIEAVRPYNPGGTLKFGADIGFSLRDNTLYGTKLKLSVSSPKISIRQGANSIALADFKAATSESYPGLLTSDALLHDIPLHIDASAGSAIFKDAKDSIHLSLASLAMKGDISRSAKGATMRTFKLAFKGSNATLASKGGLRANLRGINATLSASKNHAPVHSPTFHAPAEWSADSRTMKSIAHSPEFITMEISKSMRTIMANWKVAANIDISDIDLSTPKYPDHNHISDVGIAASFDSIVLRRADIRLQDTRARISAGVGNLRQWLTSTVPAPLVVNLDCKLDTAQINQLARIYASANPGSLSEDAINRRYSLPDSSSMIIPRNLIANIHASAIQTRYINLHLYNLDTDIDIRNGVADIRNLHIDSDFGHANLKAIYNTANLQRMMLNFKLGVEDVDVVEFFENFPKLLIMMPSMKNLSGNIGVQASAEMLIYPSMYLNVPSLSADMYVQADSMQLKQNKFIHHITRMLLIPGDEDLHIADISLHAGVHDNLLEVYPFDFEVSKYKLTLQGLNNFNGNLFYHIGVDRWPLRIPFGLNIKGTYHHPDIRFGGAGWKEQRGRDITSGIMDRNLINVMKEFRKYGTKLVRTAAKYKGN